MCNTTIIELSIARLATTPLKWAWEFQPLCPLDVAMPFATTQEESTHVKFEVDNATGFIELI